MIKTKNISSNKFLQKTLVVVFLIVIWWLISLTSFAENNLIWFAKPQEVFLAIKDIFLNEFVNIKDTFLRVLIGASLSVFIGTLLGLLVGYFNSIYELIKSTLDFWRSIPPIIVIPVLYKLDKTQDEELWRILLVLFGCLPIMIMIVADAVNKSSKKRLLPFGSLHVSPFFKLKNIIIYEVLPTFFSGSRTIISFSIIIIIVSEMVFSPQFGIGLQVLHYQGDYQIQYVYGYAFIVGLIGISLNFIFRLIESKKVWWLERN